jgi:uncharacterized membrane protein YeaQ/YmgE (transglycosylase-associated protein family)
MSWTAIITWLIVGAFAGAATGMLLGRERRGLAVVSNLGLGLAGALIGGGLFKVLAIETTLARIAISAQDLLAALVGSMIFVAAVAFAKRRKRS